MRAVFFYFNLLVSARPDHKVFFKAFVLFVISGLGMPVSPVLIEKILAGSLVCNA